MPWQNYNQLPQPNAIQQINPGWGSMLPPKPMEDSRFRLSGGMAPTAPGMTWNPFAGTGGALVPIPGYAPSTQGSGLPQMPGMQKPGMPGMPGDMMSMIKTLMAKLGGNRPAPAPFVAPQSSGASQQYLNQIKDIMGKLGQGGLPNLPPEVQQMLAQQKAAMSGEIGRDYTQSMGNAIAQGYGAGMENSSIANVRSADISGRRAQAIAQMLSGLSGQEFNIRSQIGQMQQQGQMGQIGALQNLAQMAESEDQRRQQEARQQYEQNLNMQNSQQDRDMQMLQFLMSFMQR